MWYKVYFMALVGHNVNAPNHTRPATNLQATKSVDRLRYKAANKNLGNESVQVGHPLFKAAWMIRFSKFPVSLAFQGYQDTTLGKTATAMMKNRFPHQPRLYDNSRLVRKSLSKSGSQSGCGFSFSLFCDQSDKRSGSDLFTSDSSNKCMKWLGALLPPPPPLGEVLLRPSQVYHLQHFASFA